MQRCTRNRGLAGTVELRAPLRVAAKHERRNRRFVCDGALGSRRKPALVMVGGEGEIDEIPPARASPATQPRGQGREEASDKKACRDDKILQDSSMEDDD